MCSHLSLLDGNNSFFFKGRVALFALLKALGVSCGDRVIIPGYTCVVVPLAISYLGAVPEYADISDKTYNSQLTDYAAAYERIARQGNANTVKAIVIQHTYGNPNRDTKEIVSWAKDKRFKVVEDCAHVNGVVLGDQYVGSFGDGAFFSTQWSKPFTTGLGGIAQINNVDFKDKMAQLAKTAEAPSCAESFLLAGLLVAHKLLLHPHLYWVVINSFRFLSRKGLLIGSSSNRELNGIQPENYFKRMGWIQHWILQKRGQKMTHVNTYRQQLAEEYDRLLKERDHHIFSREPGAVLIRYPLRVKNRKACLNAAKDSRIELGDWFNHPLHPVGSNITSLNWDVNVCPNATALAQDTVNLPVHDHINFAEAKRIVDFISQYIKNSCID